MKPPMTDSERASAEYDLSQAAFDEWFQREGIQTIVAAKDIRDGFRVAFTNGYLEGYNRGVERGANTAIKAYDTALDKFFTNPVPPTPETPK
jgi:hypothetical protein